MRLMRRDAMERAISDAVARVYLDTFGKGPLEVESHCHEDTVVTLLKEILTPAERSMMEAGKADSVLLTRVEWQRSTDGIFKEAVTEASGRTVLTAISGFELEQEMAVEVFLLGPDTDS